MLVLKVISLLIFIATWASIRRRKQLKLIDILVISILLIYAPYFIFNPIAQSEWVSLTFPVAAIFNAEFAFVIMFLLGSQTLWIGYAITSRIKKPSIVKASPQRHRMLFRIGIGASMVLILLFLVTPGFLDYRSTTLQFLSSNLDSSAYSDARRVLFNDTLAFQILNRIRFTLLPLILLLILSGWVTPPKYFRIIIVSAVFFVIFPLSLSKLPFIYYVGYVTLFVLCARGHLKKIGTIKLVTGSLVGFGLIIALMIPLYMLQYNDVAGFSQPFEKPVRLAIERIWGENYSIVLRYFTVYPNVLPHSDFSSINVIAKLFGLEYHNHDVDVAGYFFGNGARTTNPGIFILSGFAGFGFLGVVAYTIIVFSFVQFLDYLHGKIRNPMLQAIYFSIVGINVTFLAQLALPVSLLTYGLGVIPPLLFLIDRGLKSGAKSAPNIGGRTQWSK